MTHKLFSFTIILGVEHVWTERSEGLLALRTRSDKKGRIILSDKWPLSLNKSYKL